MVNSGRTAHQGHGRGREPPTTRTLLTDATVAGHAAQESKVAPKAVSELPTDFRVDYKLPHSDSVGPSGFTWMDKVDGVQLSQSVLGVLR